MKIWTEPKVTVIGRMHFLEPEHLPVQWHSDDPATGAEMLIEYAGRNCYQSWSNPSGKTNAEYIQNILKQGHGSVLEHASWSLLIEGVSRSLTHELVRHRAGTAFSQLSQRYVEAGEDFGVVVPPAVTALASSFWLRRWRIRVEAVLTDYREQIEDLVAQGIRGKQLKEAARSLLPNCAETKIVVTANARAWRHMIELRTTEGADAEIRRLFLAVLVLLKQEAPAIFGDFDENGVPQYSKV